MRRDQIVGGIAALVWSVALGCSDTEQSAQSQTGGSGGAANGASGGGAGTLDTSQRGGDSFGGAGTMDAGQGGGDSPGTPDAGMAAAGLLCEPSSAAGDPCEACIQTICCDEFLACAAVVECSDSTEGDATVAEFQCILNEVQALFDVQEMYDVGSGFTNPTVVQNAEETCARRTATMMLTEATTALLACVVGNAGDGSCATDCFPGYVP